MCVGRRERERARARVGAREENRMFVFLQITEIDISKQSVLVVASLCFPFLSVLKRGAERGIGYF